jgi:hypothetical protein
MGIRLNLNPQTKVASIADQIFYVGTEGRVAASEHDPAASAGSKSTQQQLTFGCR